MKIFARIILLAIVIIVVAIAGCIYQQHRIYLDRPDVHCRRSIQLLNSKDFMENRKAQNYLIRLGEYCVPNLVEMLQTNTDAYALSIGWSCLGLINPQRTTAELEKVLKNPATSKKVVLRYLDYDFYPKLSRDELGRLHASLESCKSAIIDSEEGDMVSNQLYLVDSLLSQTNEISK